MTQNLDKQTSVEQSPVLGTVRNIGEPLRFEDVEDLAGFTAESAKSGDKVRIWTRMALTSDESLFHRLVEEFAGVVNHMAQKVDKLVKLQRADTVLLVLKPDRTAELWVDTAAVSVRCSVKRAVKAGSLIFEHEIADITGMMFPCVEFGEKDKLLCLFRVDWSFGFAFDMNPEGKLDLESFTTTLGTLYRELRYRHLYQAISNEALFARLVGFGWFPFVEIIAGEFKELSHHTEAGFDLSDTEQKIIAKFNEGRLQHMLQRWLAKPHFAAKSELLKEAVEAFISGKPATVIKILLTEIEGILNDAYRTAHGGQGAKLKELLAFAETSAAQRAGGSNTLLFPVAFSNYLAKNTFANFDPVASTGTAASRHAVGHGAAAQDSYTMTRALQAILTLDQLAFYT
ncbi:hypothetical protein ACLS0R_18070 [Comamonas jiangduensis]|uniref:hypothetical protein n=1 Tax=Comamonas jiangduensis TaxID=1194168 RepID=UPI003BF782AB